MSANSYGAPTPFGVVGSPKISELLMNAAMLMERTKHIEAGPYERVEARNGHANGFKPRSYRTSMGGVNLSTPQSRGSDIPFRTSLLEKGSRSDRALKAAISSMYLQSVSTRRVTAVIIEISEEWETGKIYLQPETKKNALPEMI